MDNNYVKEFIDYLFYIGIISEEGIKQFIFNYNTSLEQFKEKVNDSSAILLEALSNYLCSLSKPQIKNYSKNILHKYEENHQKIKQKCLGEIIHLFNTKTAQKYLFKWKHQTHSKPQLTQSMGTMFQSQKLNKSSQESFMNRQEQFNQKRTEKKNKLSSQTEDDLLVQCTFSPKVFSTKDQMSPQVRNKKAIERLFSDSNRRNDIQNKKQSYDSNNKSKVNPVGMNTLYPNKVVNKLYRDAKEREVLKKNLQQQIDEERGLTFKPTSFTKDSGYEVSTQFHERNKKLIDDRQNFVFVYDYLRQSKFNDNTLYKKNRFIQKGIEINDDKELAQK